MKAEKKKRGRKPKKIEFEEEIIFNEEDSFDIEEPLILHLPLKYTDIVTVNFDKLNINVDEKPFLKEIAIKENLNPKLDSFVHINRDIQSKEEIDVRTYLSLPDKIYNFSLDDGSIFQEKTEICCWWCTYSFDSFPVYLPVKYNEEKLNKYVFNHNNDYYTNINNNQKQKPEKSNDFFNVKGIFCSFECAAAYGLKFENVKSLYLIKFFHKRLFKTKGSANIKPAPPKEILKKFGGPVSIEEFRSTCHSQNYFLYDFPVKYVPYQIGAKKIQSLIEKSVKNIKKQNKKIKF